MTLIPIARRLTASHRALVALVILILTAAALQAGRSGPDFAGPVAFPNAALHQSYSQTELATGGTAPYVFALKSGSVPPGLNLSSSGLLSGITTAAGSYEFTSTVTDATGASTDRTDTITVVASGSLPRLMSNETASDGHLGDASLYFYNDGYRHYINTDNGEFYKQYSNYPWEVVTSPAKRYISQPNGPDILVLDFTNFRISMPDSPLQIIGSRPMIIATTGDVSIAGTITVSANGGAGGTSPEGNFDSGQPGQSPSGSAVATGGNGGWGPGGIVSPAPTPWGWQVYTGSGGGGGGGAAQGADGWNSSSAQNSTSGQIYGFPGGDGGAGLSADVFQGGGGGGQGGYAHTWYCCWTGGPGGAGGGALGFSTSGNFFIAENGAINADGSAGLYYQGDAGGGGGGGGGFLLLDVAGVFENRGVLSARGGAGAAHTEFAHGGAGGGGRIAIARAISITNGGTIDVSAGDGNFTRGGLVSGASDVTLAGTGNIAGIGSTVVTGATTAAGTNVTTTSSADTTTTFSNVITGGTTTVRPIAPDANNPLPPGYTATGTAYDISTTATYTDVIYPCFIVSPLWDSTMFSRLRILHFENGAFADRTVLAPDSPAPNFNTHTVCARVSSLSPFVLALAPPAAPAHLWHADYNMEWEGVRTNGDQLIDAPYQWQYNWRFGMLNDPNGPLDTPRITVSTALSGLIASQPGDVVLTPGAPPFEWTGSSIGPSGGMFTQLNSSINVPAPYALGYEVTRELVGGREIAPETTVTRTFNMSFLVSDPLIRTVGASIDFSGVSAGQPNGPVAASGIACAGPGQVQVQDGQPVFWQVGFGPTPPPVAVNTLYTLTCSVTLTNSAAATAMFTPSIVASGQRPGPQTSSSDSATYTTPGVNADPSDPLGSVTYATSTPSTVVLLDTRFSRTVHFNGANSVVAAPPPPPPATIAGRMRGDGWLAGAPSDPDQRKRFSFNVTGLSGGQQQTSLTYWIADPDGRPRRVGVLDNATITAMAFSDDPGFTPGTGAQQPTVDSVSFSGTADWNDAHGFTFEVTATDRGEPGIDRDTFAIVIRDGEGHVVVSENGVLAGGNVQSARLTGRRVPPVIMNAPHNIEGVEATGAGGAYVTYAMPTAVDASGVAVSVSCTPASGTTFALGTSRVTCAASDASGATTTVAFKVQVVDTTAPVLNGMPANAVVEATAFNGATFTYAAPTATDIADPAPIVTCSHASTTFAIGTSTVTCKARDHRSNSSTATFTVTVVDTTAPAFTTTPANIEVTTTKAAGARVTFVKPAATDAADRSVTVACVAPSGTTFPVGVSTVTCTATDNGGNTATVSFTVTVRRQ